MRPQHKSPAAMPGYTFQVGNKIYQWDGKHRTLVRELPITQRPTWERKPDGWHRA
jgi:hypothetical protein